MNAERVRAGFARLQAEGPEAVVDLLDPAVEMLGPQASPWDCHGRHRRLLSGEGELDPQVSVDDVAGRLVDGDFRHPANFGESSRERGLLVGWMGPPVARIGDELGRCDFTMADDPATPRRGGGGLRFDAHADAFRAAASHSARSSIGTR